MLTQRKPLTSFFAIICTVATHMHGMHHQQLVLSNTMEKDALLLLTGFAIGAGCIGAYCCFSNYQNQLNSFEQRVQQLEEQAKQQSYTVKEIKKFQEEEEKRLNQTREWVLEEKEAHQKNTAKILAAFSEQQIEFGDLKTRIASLEDDAQFHSPEDSYAE